MTTERSLYKKLKTRGFFPDFWHTAKGWRENKKMCVRMERQKLKREIEKEKEDTANDHG